MARFQFSIGRIFLGMIFVALPFSTFGRMGLMGILASLMIAIPMFIACCIATREQFQSMFGIIACTVAVCFFAAALSPVSINSRSDEANYFLFWTAVGIFIGVLWSESHYARMAEKKALSAKAKEERKRQQKNDDAFQASALEQTDFESTPHVPD